MSDLIIYEFSGYNVINLSSKMNKLDAKLVGLKTLNEGAPIKVNKIETIKSYLFRISILLKLDSKLHSQYSYLLLTNSYFY